MDEDLKQHLVAMEHRMLDRVQEMVRDAQTEILKAFFPFQDGTNIRLRKLEADNSNLNSGLWERMGVIERRLQEIEKKLMLNPPAA